MKSHKKYKRKILFIFIFLFVIGVNYYLIKDSYLEILDSFQKLNIWIILFLLIYALLPHFFEALSLKKLIQVKGITDSFANIFRQVLTTLFLSYTISPTVGKGAQIVILKKKGLSWAQSCDISIADQLVNSFVTIIISILIIIFKHQTLKEQFSQFWIVALLGIVMTIVIFGFLILLYIPKINHIIHTIIQWLQKHMSQYQKMNSLFQNVLNIADGIQSQRQDYIDHKKDYLIALLFCLIKSLIYHSMPFMIMILFEYNINISDIIIFESLSYFITMILDAIPVYGDYGIAEVSFVEVFSKYISRPFTTSVMVLWRFVTFYYITILGGIMFIKYCDSDVKRYIENQ